MRRIYLASRSKARRKLLALTGLKVTVLPARVKEERVLKGSSFEALVKRNALSKAREVSSRVKGGVVIAADTISVQDNKIFGKPKDKRRARAMLKQLSRKPQMLYTGLAVIDTDNHKERVSCEKTKVYMDKLTDKEISRYFASTSPLDKAGSFDIQGRGAFFISRVEGCFYNVVGLPLRRLYRMLKGLGITVPLCLAFLSPLFFSGCATEYNLATGQEEFYYYTTEREVKIGKAVAEQVKEKEKLAEDPLVQKRVEDIGRRVVLACDRKDVDYYFTVLEDDEVNAFALPGGYVFVNSGLVAEVTSDDELAGVLAHEISHIVARHSIKRLQAMMGYSLLRIVVASMPNARDVGEIADIIFSEAILGYSREDELLADQLAARYMKAAGYDPAAMVTFLRKIQDIHRRKPPAPKNYARTHPYIADRIRIVRQELGEKLGFTDYINTEEERAP